MRYTVNNSINLGKYKLGQRQSQTPFSSAFWVQKDLEYKNFRVQKMLVPKNFWIQDFFGPKFFGTKTFLDLKSFWTQNALENGV